MTQLLSPLKIRALELKNRLVMSPMCQYSAADGMPGLWHDVHYGARAQGGVGLVMLESTAVSPHGRISPSCLGLWSQQHLEAHARLVERLHALGSAAGVQLNHAGRKGSHSAPWQGGAPLPIAQGGWVRTAPSASGPGMDVSPIQALSTQDIAAIVDDFRQAALRAVEAGFDVIELHAAHGYLLHQFLSPLANQRTDAYGGDFDGRARLTLEVAQAVREAIPDAMPLFVRLSCVDSKESNEGWTLEESIALARKLRAIGVDLLDCTSGGISAPPTKREGAFNADLAQAVRTQTGLPTGSVGGIDSLALAESLLSDGACDLIFAGRALLRDPYWLIRQTAPQGAGLVPPQYARAGF